MTFNFIIQVILTKSFFVGGLRINCLKEQAMNFLIDAFKGSLTNILVVVGVAILVPVVLPVVVTMARPVVKGVD